MLEEFIASQSEVIRVIMSDYSPCCGVPHCEVDQPDPTAVTPARDALQSSTAGKGGVRAEYKVQGVCTGYRIQGSPQAKAVFVEEHGGVLAVDSRAQKKRAARGVRACLSLPLLQHRRRRHQPFCSTAAAPQARR